MHGGQRKRECVRAGHAHAQAPAAMHAHHQVVRRQLSGHKRQVRLPLAFVRHRWRLEGRHAHAAAASWCRVCRRRRLWARPPLELATRAGRRPAAEAARRAWAARRRRVGRPERRRRCCVVARRLVLRLGQRIREVLVLAGHTTWALALAERGVGHAKAAALGRAGHDVLQAAHGCRCCRWPLLCAVAAGRWPLLWLPLLPLAAVCRWSRRQRRHAYRLRRPQRRFAASGRPQHVPRACLLLRLCTGRAAGPWAAFHWSSPQQVSAACWPHPCRLSSCKSRTRGCLSTQIRRRAGRARRVRSRRPRVRTFLARRARKCEAKAAAGARCTPGESMPRHMLLVLVFVTILCGSTRMH